MCFVTIASDHLDGCFVSQGHMRPFVIVVPDELRYFFLPGLHCSRNSEKTIVLQCLDKPFDVAVVGRCSDSAVAMDKASMLDGCGEPLGELRTVVGLDSSEFKRRSFLSFSDKPGAKNTVGLGDRPGAGPARIKINQGIGGQPIVRLAVQHRIDLNKSTGRGGQGPHRILVPLFPFGKSGAIVSLENSFDAR